MMITRKALSRREVLRAVGATVALPLLDSMVPAFGGARVSAAAATRRLGVVYVPNGIMMPWWTPKTEGAGFEFPDILKPLEPSRDHLRVLSGLNGVNGGGPHAGASTRFLTATAARHSDSDLVAGVSMDQFAARQLGQYTQLASLELAIEGRDFAGSCDIGYSCGYTNTIAWRSETTPLPMENDPRVVFERLFGDGGTTDAKTRAARLKTDRSILDAVTEKTASLQSRLGAKDRAKLSDYLEAVRDVERRIQRAEEQSASNPEVPSVAQPAGVPTRYDDHAKLMFDLQVLAYQADVTRVITFMLAREISGRTYPEINVFEAHHPTSHHQNDPAKIATVKKINTFHISLFAYYLDRLRSTPDGDGSLLDHTLVLYGAGMSDSNAHSPNDLPILLAGGAAGAVTGGRHIKFAKDPLANLHLSVLDKVGVPIEKIGNSVAPLTI
ncbi:MAG TPA: DUF1552 domain-containing protein [Vicinamibacterales bacterium]|jgi:hypothetical protein